MRRQYTIAFSLYLVLWLSFAFKTCAVLTRREVTEERLIGWKGEVPRLHSQRLKESDQSAIYAVDHQQIHNDATRAQNRRAMPLLLHSNVNERRDALQSLRANAFPQIANWESSRAADSNSATGLWRGAFRVPASPSTLARPTRAQPLAAISFSARGKQSATDFDFNLDAMKSSSHTAAILEVSPPESDSLQPNSPSSHKAPDRVSLQPNSPSSHKGQKASSERTSVVGTEADDFFGSSLRDRGDNDGDTSLVSEPGDVDANDGTDVATSDDNLVDTDTVAAGEEAEIDVGTEGRKAPPGNTRDSDSDVDGINIKHGAVPMFPPSSHTQIFSNQENGMKYSHMVTIEYLPDGYLMAAWQVSLEMEGAFDQHLMWARSRNKRGTQWGDGERVPLRKDLGVWAPVLHCDQDGTMWLFYAENEKRCFHPPLKTPERSLPQRWVIGGSIMAVTMPKGSREWSEPFTIYSAKDDEEPPKIIANKLVVLSTGEWVLPFWRQRVMHACPTKHRHTSAGVLISKDLGATWSAHGSLMIRHVTHWIIEGVVIELGDKVLQMFLRSTEGHMYRSLSYDRGATWSSAEATAIRNPDSKIHALRLRQGGHVLIYNDHGKEARIGKAMHGTKHRGNLTLYLSLDDAVTWQGLGQLDIMSKHEDVQFHYPTLLEAGHGRMLVAYSRAYIDRESARAPFEDGIWLAEVKYENDLDIFEAGPLPLMRATPKNHSERIGDRIGCPSYTIGGFRVGCEYLHIYVVARMP
ncbi:hypothetical protein CYMTET_51532 [Cymbomonas tetramitiformis]|uniref:Sialidase domain-containing protein n=1 Tax=Cymbomonas tetramitiformis TaxID=36881 RepID=A0AAE0BM39_9CHLO|nr:hypothetical protein CYMTET_51532 [Cymbomonas tetramitiformis]